MSTTKLRLFGCDGKVRFPTFSGAQRTAHLQARRHKEKFVAYSCHFCGGFHVGSTLGEVAWGVGGGTDGRQRYAIYAIDQYNREALIGFTKRSGGGRVAEIINAEPGWKISRIVDRHGKAG